MLDIPISTYGARHMCTILFLSLVIMMGNANDWHIREITDSACTVLHGSP